MKLSELKQSPLAEEISLVWADQEQLDEGIWNSMRTGFSQIATSVTTVIKSANARGELNDRVIRQMYIDEVEKFKDVLSKAPSKAQDFVNNKLLPAAGIKLSGVDLSRKNLNRIMILKVMRLVLFAINQMRDNGIQWLLSSVVTGGLSMIINILMSAKDAKEIGAEMVNISRQLKKLFDASAGGNDDAAKDTTES